MKSKFLTFVLSLAVFFSAGIAMAGCDVNNNQNMHKITIMSDDSQNAAVLSVVYTNGKEEITLPQQAARLGYINGGFAYYETKTAIDDSTGQPYLDASGNAVTYQETVFIDKDSFKDKALDKDLVVFAKYYAKTYNIRYFIDGVPIDSSDATLAPIYYQTSSEAVDLPSRTAPAGYVFDGWYLSLSYDAADKISTIPAGSSGDLVLYGRFLAE